MSLYEDWLRAAYTREGRAENSFWKKYMPVEKEVYKELLSTRTTAIKGTINELSERFRMPATYVCGFIDGINGALEEEVEVKDLTPDSELQMEYNFVDLYKKMVEYKAEHLYSLPEWEGIFDEETRKSLYTEQKKSKTVVKQHEPGRNESCPCGSGKKYKKCCGAV